MRSPWACVLLVTVAVAGCEAIPKQSDSVAPTATHPGADADRNRGAYDGRGEVAAYLNFLGVLDSTDEQGWNTMFEHTLSAYQEDPTRERRLRLALVMSRADGKSAERQVTRNMLADSRKLLDSTAHDGPAATPPLVRKFAQLQVAEIELRLALYDELQSLRSQLAKAHQANQTAQRDRTEAEARIRSIDAALAEANAKLEAVMKIERNIGPTGKETFP